MDIQSTEQSRLPEGKKQTNFWVWVGCFIVTLIILPWGTEKVLLGQNGQAYQMLVKGGESGRYSVIHKNAEKAIAQADDPDLIAVLKLWKDQSSYALEAGIYTIEEGKTLTGLFKGVGMWFKSPLKSAKQFGDEVSRMFSSKSKSESDRVNEKYYPIMQHAETVSRTVFWVVLVGGGIGLFQVYKSRKAVS